MGDGSGSHVRIVGMFAGVGSGLTKVAVGHGFDTIKTRLQCSPPGTYKGAIDCLKQTVRNESIFALYKGAIPPAVGWAFIDSALLGSLHNYRLFLIRNGMTETTPGSSTERLTVVGHGLAGLAAGLTSAFPATPMELIKVKLQLQMQRYAVDREFKGPIHCIRQIIAIQGIPGLWTGFTGSLLFRSNFMWMFACYEILMRGFSRFDNTSFALNTGTATFLSGGFASFGFWFMAMPADNIKNRMMATPLASHRQSALRVAKAIIQSEGVKGFYRGMTPVVLRAFPVNASALFVYEGLMRVFGAEKVRGD
ncbi:mitochondrial carrier [Schizopora paradoxa]|uniref:Mitochondrial carrier n=1 Tax=Schizopora paradoxa TaxID=27342 RepID=A0A0H2RPV8_9AGAM|nr:mitochondrial carrier [Schizopora paradoxa]